MCRILVPSRISRKLIMEAMEPANSHFLGDVLLHAFNFRM